MMLLLYQNSLRLDRLEVVVEQIVVCAATELVLHGDDD
jgi:hypothetical protein